MRIVFRVDASTQIGTGHVMRCLTLADALTEQGAECQFICREHPGSLISSIRGRGYYVHELSVSNYEGEQHAGLVHAAWLGSSQLEDAICCKNIAKTIQLDWLIVDHYALDTHWERMLRPYCKQLMVIDDLADRRHDCDLLLDQNLGHQSSDYETLVPEKCARLVGPRYALLRPEFARLREPSLARRKVLNIHRIMISLGGVDRTNVTGQVLSALGNSGLSLDVHLDIIMGTLAPHLELVRQQASELPFSVTVSVNVADMAKRMMLADLAIGAAGSTSWERACLGVPCILLVLAENQRSVAKAIKDQGLAIIVENCALLAGALEHVMEICDLTETIRSMVVAGSRLVDGVGCSRVVSAITKTKKR